MYIGMYNTQFLTVPFALNCEHFRILTSVELLHVLLHRMSALRDKPGLLHTDDLQCDRIWKFLKALGDKYSNKK